MRYFPELRVVLKSEIIKSIKQRKCVFVKISPFHEQQITVKNELLTFPILLFQ